jgi:hypothetical protein
LKKKKKEREKERMEKNWREKIYGEEGARLVWAWAAELLRTEM